MEESRGPRRGLGLFHALPRSYAGAPRGTGPGLCRILDMDFREYSRLLKNSRGAVVAGSPFSAARLEPCCKKVLRGAANTPKQCP